MGLAVSVTEAPVHAELVLGLMDAAGKGLTVTVDVIELLQPISSVVVMV